MSLLGLIKKFPVDRPLTPRDRQLWLEQKKRLEKRPRGQVSAIKINSTYIEVVDKYFHEKGFSTFGTIVIIAICIWMIAEFVVLAFELKDSVYRNRHGDLALLLSVMGTMTSALVCFVGWGLRQEAFRYTHYPIRLNRMNRMVYVHRIDGTILRIPWDEVFFTLVQEPMFPSGMGANWAIHGHVLDADGETVRETFAFSVVEIPEIVTGHWEFLRRYMEEGPQAVEKHIEYYVQVSTQEQREPFRHSMRFSLWRYGGFSLVLLPLLPLDFLIACARWVAMRTGKLPVWPDDVEAECAVADDDPWVRDARNNPAKYR